MTGIRGYLGEIISNSYNIGALRVQKQIGKIKNVINYLMVFNFFTGAFVINNGFFDFYVNYVFMAFFMCVYILFYHKISFSRSFVCVLAVAVFLSFLNVLWGNNTIPLLLKTTIAFVLNGTVYYLLIRMNNYDINQLFRIYLRIACIIALIGIFQELSFLVKFKPGYDFRFFIPRMVKPDSRSGLLCVTSILQEPAHFGAVIMPAIFVSILNILKWKNNFISRKSSFVVVISAMLTFSLVAYAGIIVAVIAIVSNCKQVRLILWSAVILIVFSCSVYKGVPMVKLKVDDTVAVLRGKKPLHETNLSTFAICSNGFVAYKSFVNNPWFGSGLGSHPISYDRYIAQAVDPLKIIQVLNRTDAASLLLRLVSEMGLFGLLLFFYFIIKFYVSKKRNDYYWMISNAILCLFIVNLLRQGNYFYSGFIFFVWAYYFTDKNARIKKIDNGKAARGINT
ncbi:MAG: hypothetical protein ABIH85_00705 [Candidatus Omnitrophota bacterium]